MEKDAAVTSQYCPVWPCSRGKVRLYRKGNSFVPLPSDPITLTLRARPPRTGTGTLRTDPGAVPCERISPWYDAQAGQSEPSSRMSSALAVDLCHNHLLLIGNVQLQDRQGKTPDLCQVHASPVKPPLSSRQVPVPEVPALNGRAALAVQ